MHLLFYSFLVGSIGSFASLVLTKKYRNKFASFCVVLEGLICSYESLSIISSGKTTTFNSNQLLPFFGIRLSLDPLSAYFILITSLLAIAVGIYQLGYIRHSTKAKTPTFIYPFFFTSMVLVPISNSVATFMASWEIMAITSILLVLTDHAKNNNSGHATQWYALMTHLGAASIFIGFLILSLGTKHQQFSSIVMSSSSLSTIEKSLAFFLLFIGFASKAGATPFHVWLPRAHPQAPSPVSAMMSGAMVNLGIYGIIKTGMTLIKVSEGWWWIVVIAIGTISAIYGALQCVTNSDIKKLLAYSTIDNVGLMIIGIGASGLLATAKDEKFALFMISGVLFQMLAHSIFKGLLFLSAGSIQYSTGSLNLDQLGGLLKKIPLTSTCLLIGAFSISALPPFSGFSSEWVLFEGLFRSILHLSGVNRLAVLFGLSGFALASGLTATAFVKTTGIGLLGVARSSHAETAKEVPPTMLFSTFLLALSCLVIGIVPGYFLKLTMKSSQLLFPAKKLSPNFKYGSIDLPNLATNIDPLLLLVLFTIALLMILLLLKAAIKRKVRITNSWGCGNEYSNSKTQYTATSFAEPLQRVFADVIRPDQDLVVSHVEESRFYVNNITYSNLSQDSIERFVYVPIKRAVTTWGKFASQMQNGSTHRYLSLGFIVLLIVILVLS